MIKIDCEDFEYVKFPDGTYDISKKGSDINAIDWFYTGDMTELFVILSLLEYNHVRNVKFHFLPYARQDKKQGFGGLYPFLKIFEPYERSTNFHVFDPHNTLSLPRNWKSYKGGFWDGRMDKHGLIIFADENAYDKYESLYDRFEMMYAEKERDPKTGSIISIKLSEDIPDEKQDIYVVDDICDGGATFIMLAKILPKDRTLHLFTTYGIYSNGKECLYDAGYKTVECRHSIFGR